MPLIQETGYMAQDSVMQQQFQVNSYLKFKLIYLLMLMVLVTTNFTLFPQSSFYVMLPKMKQSDIMSHQIHFGIVAMVLWTL